MTDRFWPSLCENVRAPFWRVNFSHVEAISGDLLHRIRLSAILRGERNEFLHGLGRNESLGVDDRYRPEGVCWSSQYRPLIRRTADDPTTTLPETRALQFVLEQHVSNCPA